MAKSTVKTKETGADVHKFIEVAAASDRQRQDSFAIVELMQKISGHAPVMWGPSIIGFGKYHYRSAKGTQEADAPLVGFSPRKAAISLYVFADAPGQQEMLMDLGKFKMGKACIYVKKLSDINQDALKKLVNSTISFLQDKFRWR